MKKSTIITLVSLVAATSFSSAATTLIDFSDSAGTTSGNWNNMTNAGGNSITGLIDDTGAASTIGLSLTLSAGSGFGGGVFNSTDSGAAPFDIASAFSDGLFTNSGNSITLAFGGLANNTDYEFSLYGGRANDSNWGDATVAVTTGTAVLGGDFSVQENNITTFTITSDGSGNASFTFTETASVNGADNSTLSALSITAVPEPSSTALLGLGGLALTLRRRR